LSLNGSKTADFVKKLISSDLAVLFVIMGLASMAMAILQPIIPLYLTSNNVVPSLIGLMLAVGMVGMVLGESSGGWLADKIGLKFPMSVGTFLCAPLVLCFVFLPGVPALFLIFIFWGIVRAAVFGPARGYIGNTADLENKATIIAVYMTFMTVARSLGSLASGFVADSRGYNWDFYISMGVSVLAGLLVIVGLRKTPFFKPLPKIVNHAFTPAAAAVRPPVKYRPVVFQCIIAALFFMGMGVNSFMPLLATQYVGVKATQVGILTFIGGGVSTILFIPMGKLADRKDKKLLMITGLLLSAAGLIGMGFAREYVILILMVIVCNIGYTMFTPSAVALLSNSVPGYWQSTAMGIYGAAEDVGVILGSSVGGFVWTAGGPAAVYLMGGVASVVGALICLGFIRDLAANKALKTST
jgi:MFS transporter, PPP family, 3-phenylpropionic acid transporter